MAATSDANRFELPKESELRIEVGWDAPLRLQLTSGTAEIFGTELPPQFWVTFPPGHKFAVFTWYGATVDVDGTPEVAYVADETPMVCYVNVHAVLDRCRAHAKEASMSIPSNTLLLSASQKPEALSESQEKLCSMLKDVLKTKTNVDIVKLHKSEGVVPRNNKYRQRMRIYRTREYFYGLTNELSPHANVASFSDLHIFRIGGGPQAPRSALPIGAEPSADPTRLVHVTINSDLIHSVLAVSFAKEPEQLLSSNVAGFIYITDVDIQRKKITFVAPCPGELPSRLLLAGSLTWVE